MRRSDGGAAEADRVRPRPGTRKRAAALWTRAAVLIRERTSCSVVWCSGASSSRPTGRLPFSPFASPAPLVVPAVRLGRSRPPAAHASSRASSLRDSALSCADARGEPRSIGSSER